MNGSLLRSLFPLPSSPPHTHNTTHTHTHTLRAQDTVKIIDNSENQGKVGTLIGTDVEDGIVKIGDGGSSDILIKPLGMLVKFHVNED